MTSSDSNKVRYFKSFTGGDKNEWVGIVSLDLDVNHYQTSHKFIVHSKKAIKLGKTEMAKDCRRILSKSSVKLNMKQVEMAVFAKGWKACYYTWYDEKSHLFDGIIGLCGGKVKQYRLRFDKNTCIRLKQNKVIELTRTLKRKYEKYVLKSTGLWVPWLLPLQEQQGWQYWNNKTRNCIRCGITREELGRKLKVCAGCGSPRYCGRHCQKIHWKNYHRVECKKMYS